MQVVRISLQTACPHFVFAVGVVTLALKRYCDLVPRLNCKVCGASVSSLGPADICQTIGTNREHGCIADQINLGAKTRFRADLTYEYGGK